MKVQKGMKYVNPTDIKIVGLYSMIGSYTYCISHVHDSVEWSIVEGSAYATIGQDGTLTALENGIVKIKALVDGGLELYKSVIVTKATSGIYINGNDYAMVRSLYYVYFTQGVSKGAVTWSIVDGSEYATINKNGRVDVLADGDVTIKATLVSDSSVYAMRTIRVRTSICLILGEGKLGVSKLG